MSSAASASSFDAGNFLTMFQCAVSLTPLEKAVSLEPCMHKINEDIAQRHFGTIAPGQLKAAKACPICRQPVTAYYKDDLVQSITRELFKASKPDVLPQACARVEADGKTAIQEIIPFDKVVKFKSEGDWNTINNDSRCCKELTFKATARGSIFEKISFWGRQDGTIELDLSIDSFASNYSKFETYLAKAGIPRSCTLPVGVYLTNLDLIRQLFKILCVNIGFPEKELALLRKVIEAGNWKKAEGLST